MRMYSGVKRRKREEKMEKMENLQSCARSLICFVDAVLYSSNLLEWNDLMQSIFFLFVLYRDEWRRNMGQTDFLLLLLISNTLLVFFFLKKNIFLVLKKLLHHDIFVIVVFSFGYLVESVQHPFFTS